MRGVYKAASGSEGENSPSRVRFWRHCKKKGFCRGGGGLWGFLGFVVNFVGLWDFMEGPNSKPGLEELLQVSSFMGI